MTEPQNELERLEQRVAQLETVVRALLAERGGGARPLMAAPALPSAAPHQHAATPADAAPASPWPSGPPLPPSPPASRLHPFAPRPARDWEQWFGQRGLLIVGVLALLGTGGFFLNYAFDRGWVPEWLRATIAVVGGIGVAWWGDRLVVRGMRRYGAALIGAGGGLVYLGCWAAAGPYALVGKDAGVMLLALSSGAVALFAVRHEVEALALWALAGAYLAPAFLPHPEPNVEKFLAYMAVIGVASLYLGHQFGWRRTFGVALFGFFLLPALFVYGRLDTTTALGYAALGGVTALLMTDRRPWPEARLGALILPWVAVLNIADAAPPDSLRWAALAAGGFLAGVVWWQQRRLDPLATTGAGAVANLAEAFVFVASPLALVGLAALAPPDALAPWGGAVPLALAGLYIAGGWERRLAHLVGMGLALLALAVSGQWDGTAVAVGWALLALAGVVADRSAGQPAACDVGVALGVVAFIHLFAVALPLRPPGDATFVGSWALGGYVVLTALALAARLWMPRTPPGPLAAGGAVLWVAAGATLLAGGSVELHRAFESRLAGDLAISTYWLLFAAGLVLIGFRREWKGVRTAGLIVAGLAALKIVVYDLAQLEALYRVASCFVLAVIALAVAYAYNRRAARRRV